jgi:hypothetical protein
MMTDGLDFPHNMNGLTLPQARRPVSLDPLRIVARFRTWRQPSPRSRRSVPRAGP